MTDTNAEPRRVASRTPPCSSSSSPCWWSPRSSVRTSSPPLVAARRSAGRAARRRPAAASGAAARRLRAARRPRLRVLRRPSAPTANGVTGDPVEGTAQVAGGVQAIAVKVGTHLLAQRHQAQGRRSCRDHVRSGRRLHGAGRLGRPRVLRGPLGGSEGRQAAGARQGYVRVLVRHGHGLRPDRRRVGAAI